MKRMSPATYAGALLLLIVTILGFSGVYVAINDPYWIWRQEPPWYRQWRGHNRVLDTKQRFAKAIQLVFRRPKIIIIGSSRVYRGINTEGHGASVWYNAGISSLRIREADAFIRHALNWTPATEIVLGLDYFMFDSNRPSQPGFDNDLQGRGFMIKAVPVSLFTEMAFRDALGARRGKGRDDGYWTYSGFKITKARSQEIVERALERFNIKRTAVTPAEYEVFSSLLDYPSRHGVRLVIFLSPLNRRQVDGMKADREYDAFMAWRERVSAIAKDKGIEFHDFSLNNPFYHDRIAEGSTPNWIDASHYAPVVGEWILRSIGLE